MSDVVLKIELVTGGRMPEKAHKTDADWDVFARLDQDVIIPPGGRALIPAGFIAEIPPGWRIKMESRSGLGVKNGVMIGAGVIDAGYANEIGVLVHNTNPPMLQFNISSNRLSGVSDLGVKNIGQSIIITHGMKIAQFAVERVYDVELVLVSETNKDTERNINGIGSTGV